MLLYTGVGPSEKKKGLQLPTWFGLVAQGFRSKVQASKSQIGFLQSNIESCLQHRSLNVQ